MAKLSFKSGSARITIEAESEEQLAAYLAHLVYESIGSTRYPAPAVKLTWSDPDGVGKWPVTLETPERDEFIEDVRSSFDQTDTAFVDASDDTKPVEAGIMLGHAINQLGRNVSEFWRGLGKVAKGEA